jgi:hypothetical protein
MGWQERLETAIDAAMDGDCHTTVNVDLVGHYLLTMPTPDRIALARELLEGTGRVVAIVCQQTLWETETSKAVYRSLKEDRAAMLADDAGDG